MSEFDQDLTFDDIGQLLMKEMRRRLGNSEKAADLPGTLLMRLVEQYTKALEKKNEIEQAKLDQEKLDPLEYVAQEGLPEEHRLAVLLEYVDEVEDQWQRASDLIMELREKLEKEVEGDDAETV